MSNGNKGKYHILNLILTLSISQLVNSMIPCVCLNLSYFLLVIDVNKCFQ